MTRFALATANSFRWAARARYPWTRGVARLASGNVGPSDSETTSASPSSHPHDDANSSVPNSSSSEHQDSPIAEGILSRPDVATTASSTAHSLGPILGSIQGGMEALHSSTGLPWWATIVVTTVAVRTSLFPFSVIQARHTERFMKARPELATLRQHLRAKLDELPGGAIQERLQKISIFLSGARGIMGLHGCHPLGLVAAPLTTIPVFVAFVWATRAMMRSGHVTGVSSGGLWWFFDLTAADSTGVLPLTAVACTYVSTEISLGSQPTRLAKTMKDVLQSFVILSLPFVVTLPQGVFMYWIPSSLFTAAQVVAMRNTRFRRVFGLQPVSNGMSPTRLSDTRAAAVRDTPSRRLETRRTPS